MAIGRTDERQNPLIPVAETCRRVVWMSLADPIWASGHRLASKAGHMTAFEPTPISRKTLEPYGPFSNRVSLVNSLLLTSATVPGSRFSPRSEDIRRNIWSEAQALQCPQRAHVAFTRPNGLPRSQPAPSPRRATITSETRPGWILLKRGSGGRGLLGPAERLPRAPHAVQDY